jgi:uncharacterized protein (TIGR02246 family)
MPARKPEECDLQFSDHVNAGDLEALLALYEPTCAYVDGDGSVLVGHDAIRPNFTRLLAMRPRIDLTVVKVVPAGEGVAMVYSDWRLTAKGADGQPIARAGRAIEVVRRQPDGTWRFAADDPFARGRGDA